MTDEVYDVEIRVTKRGDARFYALTKFIARDFSFAMPAPSFDVIEWKFLQKEE